MDRVEDLLDQSQGVWGVPEPLADGDGGELDLGDGDGHGVEGGDEGLARPLALAEVEDEDGGAQAQGDD